MIRMRSSGRRPKLRTQVLAGVLAITLLALAAFDFIAITELHGYLVRQSGQRLQAALTVAQPRVNVIVRAERTFPVPGAYTILLLPHAQPARPIVLEAGPRERAVAVKAAALSKLPRSAPAAGPKMVLTYRPVATVVRVLAGVQVATVRVPAGTLVAGTSLTDVNATVSRFRLIVIAGSAAAGLLICGGVTLVIRRATALNGMLTRVEATAAEHEAAEAVMRRFLADASHELRTPLASLRANAELYQQGALRRGPQVDEAMRRIVLEAQRMSRLVDDMLHLARLDQLAAPDHQPVDVGQLAEDSVREARIADPRRVYRVSAGTGLIAHGDADLLRRALDNLLANVRTHTPAGTTACVTVHRADDELAIEVSDDGPGVPGDDLPHVFDRFYRANAPFRRPGSGLGLAIVAEVAAAHGGIARATANQPHGLRIAVTVPALVSQPQLVITDGVLPPGRQRGEHGGEPGQRRRVRVIGRAAEADDQARPPAAGPLGGELAQP
jgi:two-component system, OmpR family, sensor kinase